MNTNQTHGDERQTQQILGASVRQSQTQGQHCGKITSSTRPRTAREWRKDGAHAPRKAKPRDHMVLTGETRPNGFHNSPGCTWFARQSPPPCFQ